MIHTPETYLARSYRIQTQPGCPEAVALQAYGFGLDELLTPELRFFCDCLYWSRHKIDAGLLTVLASLTTQSAQYDYIRSYVTDCVNKVRMLYAQWNKNWEFFTDDPNFIDVISAHTARILGDGIETKTKLKTGPVQSRIYVYYHVTERANLQSVLTRGLIPTVGPRSKKSKESGPAVYFFPEISDLETAAMNWMSDEFNDPVVLQITLDGPLPRKPDQPEYERTATWTILPDKIKLLNIKF